MTREARAAGSESPAARFEIDERRDALLRLIGVKPVVMGVLNVTPDSFSDGARFQSLDLALAQARKLVAASSTLGRNRLGRVRRRFRSTRNGAGWSRCSRPSWPRSTRRFR